MATQTQEKTVSEQPSDFEQKVEKLRELYADATEFSKTAENVVRELRSGGAPGVSTPQTTVPGGIGARRGKVSELTVFVTLKPGAANRMRAFLSTLHDNIGNQGVDKVGTVHDMRFVFLDNDTKLLFCTAYDGDWGPYIDDFGTIIPDILDLQFGEVDGWPGIRRPGIKDWIVRHEVPAYFWYVANPDLTVVQTRKLKKVGKAVDEFLDKVG